MQIIDNKTVTTRDDLAQTVSKGSKLSIAAACFSLYAYQALKKQLDDIEELRFIFTSPAFLQEQTPKTSREFYIPRLNRERSLYGTEFEVKLRNELTQKAIARECANWIREKVRFKSNQQNGHIDKFINVRNADGGYSYTLANGFTTADLGCERGDNILATSVKFSHKESSQFIDSFNVLWNDNRLMAEVTEQVIEEISEAYKENSPEYIYYVAIYNIFREFLEDLDEDELLKESTGIKKTAIWNKLYDFQKEAASQIIAKLNRYNGCILADSVGLGKTFTALAVIKYFEIRNQRVLVLCPKKLGDNWLTLKKNYKNNPIASDNLRYDVLYHTDLSRESGMSGENDLAKLNWGTYDLVVIDESHAFRNGGEFYTTDDDDRRENRYLQLMNKVIRDGVKTKVLMLSATPVNNGFSDLRHQLELAYEGKPEIINEKLDTRKSIDVIFRQAQGKFNQWSKLDPVMRTTENLLGMLDFDFFTMLDSVTIARSRKHIEKYYNIDEIGKFPERMKPLKMYAALTDLPDAITYDEIHAALMNLTLAVYTPMVWVHESRRGKYIKNPENKGDVLRIMGLEAGMRKLMAVNLLKRLESSVDSFRMTIGRIITLISDTITTINEYNGGSVVFDAHELSEDDFAQDDHNRTDFAYGKHRRIDLADMDFITWQKFLTQDLRILQILNEKIGGITPEHDTKLQTLLELIQHKIENPFNKNNKKILIFSAFSDTVEYLYRNVEQFVKQFGLDVAMVTGSRNKSTAKLKYGDLNEVLTLFSPISKDKHLLMTDNPSKIDVLIATDCISEGQNLQDCDYCVNYDIHWNPVRIIQRFGRIDRIGSRNAKIQLVNFWADVDLDAYLNLKGRVETRMKAGIMVATGDDNIIDPTEKGDLEYRRAQLERLKEEVVDIEEMQSGVSIMDLGLNEFRLDLVEYMKRSSGRSLEKAPLGLHAVVKRAGDLPFGTIFVLKNRNNKIDENDRNMLHPFYMVYVRGGSNIYIDHLQPKKLLDVLRNLCKGNETPDDELCKIFNDETKDGRDMKLYSALLHFAVKSIIDINEGNDIDDFLSGAQMSFVDKTVDGLDDFELVCFVTVR